MSENNPFNEISQIFVDNQRTFSTKCNNLIERTTTLTNKLTMVKDQINHDPFSANLNTYLNIEEEARLILVVAKEVEFQRDQINKTVELLKASNKVKLNK